MKQLLLSLAFLSLTGLAFAQEKGIRFERQISWTEIKAKAKIENKYIFMDVFATWCGPCKQMDKEVYPIEKVGAFMNDKFIAVKVQSNKTSEDTEFIKSWYKDTEDIISKYKINEFPSYLYFSPDGKLVNKAVGIKSIENFISGSSAAIDSSRVFANKVEKFNRNQMDYALMPEFARKAKSLYQLDYAQKIADYYTNMYLFKLEEQALFNKENLNFIGEFLDNEDSRAFKLFMNESERVNSVLGDYEAQKSIMHFIDKKYLPQGDLKKIKKSDWDALEKVIVTKFGVLGQEQIAAQRMIYFLVNKDWNNYGIWYQKYFERGLKHAVFNINTLSWLLFENVEDSKVLKFACDVVMKYAVEKWYQNDANSWDTYANLLYKTGRKNQAIEWEEKAVRLSGNKESMVETLKKMRKNLKTWPEMVKN